MFDLSGRKALVTGATGGIGEAVVSGLVEAGYTGTIRRIAAADSFVPLGDAANLVLVGEDDVVEAALGMAGRPAQPELSWSPPSPDQLAFDPSLS
mgnify:CR=1 FL=1